MAVVVDRILQHGVDEAPQSAHRPPRAGIPSMSEFNGYGRLLRGLQRWPCEPSAVMVCVDIRDLRMINRLAGPATGDDVLHRVESRLLTWAGPQGRAERLWSNEFIALRPIDHPQAAADEVAQLRDALAAMRYVSRLGQGHLGVAIGMCVVRSGTDWVRAIQDVGEACRAAKLRGVNQIVTRPLSDPAARSAEHDADVIGHFRELLAAGQLRAHLQPIMAIGGTVPRLAKAEFLLRVEQGGRALPLPAGTIETLERCGLSTELDGFVCQHVLEWLAAHPQVAERLDSVSINLSAQSLMDGNFMDSLLRAVRAHPVAARHVCFEMTETAAVENLELAAEIIEAFRAAGCRWSLDDFGSGLCSFGYLHSLRVDEVKIDGRFTRELNDSVGAREIVRAINQVAHATGKKTVAEFVDQHQRLQILRSIGVDYAQGWLFHPALSPERFLELLGSSLTQAA
jgi:EAL domain-containing protein (putative c-di-GMP-specific phosphodiesterase class I)/GGDEF domain-containing protein